MADRSAALNRLARAARWAGLRLRLAEVVRKTALLLPVPLVYAVGALTYIKVARPPPEVTSTLVWLGLLPVGVFIGAVLQVIFVRRHKHAGAIALDRHHGFDDRITNALSFGELAEEKQTPLMRLAIEDAISTSREVSPRRAAPIGAPPELLVSLLLTLALVSIALLEVRTTRVLPPEKDFQPMVMTNDDIELFREVGRELEQKSDDPEALSSARRFNQLVEDIAQRRLDRREVFQRLEQLERELSKGAEADREALEDGLKGLAKELEKADLAKPLVEPLKQKRLADAEKAMRELAEKLKRKQDPPSKAELERLRQAMEKASKTQAERLQKLEQERQRVEEEKKKLLNKKQPDGGLDAKDRQALEKKERQLEKLDREKKQAERSRRKMSELDQKLAKAAQDLMRDMGEGAKDLESAAEDMNRMAREEMSEEEKKDMLKRLEELREVLRQQGKGGQQRMARMMRFGERARGRQGSGQGDGENQGDQGRGQQPGGKQPGGQGGEELVIGRGLGGKSIPLPGSGQGQSQGQGAEQSGQGAQGDKPGEGSGRGGQTWGTGHDPNLQGQKTAGEGKTQDVTAAGIDTGQGSASSEVIYGAAQRGFVGKGYKKVYVEYRTVAEQVMTKDEIPPGYRFYVQRYFQLIRPRE